MVKKLKAEINVLAEIEIKKEHRQKINELCDAMNGAHLSISVLSAKIGRINRELQNFLDKEYPETNNNKGVWRLNKDNTKLARKFTWQIREDD